MGIRPTSRFFGDALMCDWGNLFQKLRVRVRSPVLSPGHGAWIDPELLKKATESLLAGIHSGTAAPALVLNIVLAMRQAMHKIGHSEPHAPTLWIILVNESAPCERS